MSKTKTIFKCKECGKEFARMQFGKCANCGAFGSIEETTENATNGATAGLKNSGATKPVKKANTINELNAQPISRIMTDIGELDRVLGGGFVNGEVVMLSASPGSGKALKHNTMIPLAKGGFKLMSEIIVNDELIDMHGHMTKVLAKFNPKISEAYRMTFSDGTTVDACGDHLWSLYNIQQNIHKESVFGYDIQTISTSEIFNEGVYESDNSKKWGVPVSVVETYPEQVQSIDAYTLGKWLSDAYIADASDETDLHAINLINNKHIPVNYLYGSVAQRQEILRGLMDASGSTNTNDRAEIVFSNNQLLSDVQQLISSLGMEVNIEQFNVNGKFFNGVYCKISFDPNFDCFKIGRVLNELRVEKLEENRQKLKYLTGIEKISSEGDYYCIMVDAPSKTFMCTKNFIPTHNSTLSMSVSDKFANMGKKVLYISGEESEQQIALRAQRMNVSSPLIKIVNETTVETILGHIEDEKPDVLIIDSLQTMASSELTGSMGSIGQSKEAASTFTVLAKKQNIITILISQVTKGNGNELNFAGSNQIAHIVDCILYLESDSETPLRFLRAEKNRFGDTTEVGVFQHEESGLMEVADPSGILLNDDDTDNLSGTSMSFISEGVRQIPVEIQALVTTSNMPNPRKQFNGVDYNRGQIVCAILDKFCNARLYDNDVFVNTVSGIKVKDPMADLALAASILSSLKDKPFKVRTAFAGELSLTGQVRGSFMIENKIREAERLGFERIVIPKTAQKAISKKFNNIEVSYISFVRDLKDFLD